MVSMRNKALLILTAAVFGGCGSTSGLFGNSRSGASSESPEIGRIETGSQASLDVESLAVYLDLMRQLIEGDAVTQAETFRSAANAAELAPTTTNRLKYALALATPGHASSDAAAAERSLSDLLAQGAALLPAERVLATVHLRDVEQRLILDAEAEQIRQSAAEELATQVAESAQRLEAALEENRRLNAELETATEALDAITTIERSIRERENGPNPP